MPDPEYGLITDEKIRRLRLRVGADLDPANFAPAEISRAAWRPVTNGYNQVVTPDAVRHFVNGYGDDNPLYCDPAYAEASSWRGLIAPPTFVWTMCDPQTDQEVVLGGGDEPPRRLTAAGRELFAGDPLRGTGSVQSRVEYEFYRPLEAGDRLYGKRTILAVEDRPSRKSGRAVHVTWGLVTWNQDRLPVHLQRGTWVRTERRQANGEGVPRKRVQPSAEPYTDEQLAEIDAAYAAESRRGSSLLHWDDVQVGDRLPVLVKGPLRQTDIILWHAGWGQGFPTYAFRLAYERRVETPGLYTRNEYNVPDIVQRMHWDKDWAQRVGAAERYDYGALRETWLCQLLTHWAGDRSWISSIDVEHRKYNYIGDTTWLKGEVTGKRVTGGQHRVAVKLWCENQRGEVTSPATAEVVLPGKDAGLGWAPPVPGDPVDLLRAEIARFAGTA
ncbi:FAS1-like dehydratase domain-containing protein [Amycolatopsis jejuensis]|uniref:FAS1-like dehydratase domain-containing protein n=1 Tax=Amycolatopsis jejuensis TaxID=330084 RepID=UPI000526C31D|nr:MaoC family dehydratase N-terminal domain-containing protein [Amycolatopsis jejuensis]